MKSDVTPVITGQHSDLEGDAAPVLVEFVPENHQHSHGEEERDQRNLEDR